MKSKNTQPAVFAGLIGMVSLIFLVYVWGKVDYVRVGYELDVLSQKKAALQRTNDQLQLDLSRLTAPDRIASEAGKTLGLAAPKPDQVVLVAVQSFEGRSNQRHAENARLVVAAQPVLEGR